MYQLLKTAYEKKSGEILIANSLADHHLVDAGQTELISELKTPAAYAATLDTLLRGVNEGLLTIEHKKGLFMCFRLTDEAVAQITNEN